MSTEYLADVNLDEINEFDYIHVHNIQTKVSKKLSLKKLITHIHKKSVKSAELLAIGEVE